MKVKIDNETVIETDKLTLDQLLNADDNLFAKIKEIEAKVRLAKGEAKLNGNYRDPDWFARANKALSLSKRNRERLLRAITERRKEEKEQKQLARELRFERLFVKVAKDTLPPETYQELIAATQARFRNEDEVSPEAVEALQAQVE